MSWSGRLLHIHIAERASLAMEELDEAKLIAGLGIEGGGRLNFPCKYLEKLLARPVYTALLNRSGLNCRIEVGGTIRKGDAITPLDD